MLCSALRKFSLVNGGGYSVVKHILPGYNHRGYATVAPAYVNEVSKEVLAFDAAYPRFIDGLLNYTKTFDKTLGLAWYEKNLRYNLYEEHPGRGYFTVLAFKALANDSQLTQENLELARYIGWCSKLSEVAVLVGDDMADGSSLRRGSPCWHTLEGVQNHVANDALMLILGAFAALEKFIGDQEYYVDVLKILLNATFATMIGQTLDYLYAKENIIYHSREKYDHSVNLKACELGIYAPVVMAMRMCGFKDPETYKSVKDVLFEIARFWQMRNDYWDCFGRLTSTSKSDIQENKLTWLSITFMELANEEQRKIMQECYGKPDPQKIEKVKSMFIASGLDKLYLEKEKECYDNINRMIDDCPYEKLRPAILTIADNLYIKYEV